VGQAVLEAGTVVVIIDRACCCLAVEEQQAGGLDAGGDAVGGLEEDRLGGRHEILGSIHWKVEGAGVSLRHGVETVGLIFVLSPDGDIKETIAVDIICISNGVQR
jgi:hypothetical protein